MNINQVKKEIEKNNWYRQEAAAKLLYLSAPWYASQNLKVNGRKILQNKFKIYLFYKNHQLIPYFSKTSSKRISQYYYNRQSKDSKFVNKLYRDWKDKYIKLLKEEIKRINEEKLSDLNNSELLKLYNNFNKIFYKVWQESFFLDGFDYYGDILIKSLKKKEQKDIAFQDFQILLFSSLTSILQKERLALLNITEKIAKSSAAKKDVINSDYRSVINRYRFIKKDLEKHSSLYYWISNDFAEIERLDSKYFYKNIKELLKDKQKLEKEREFSCDIARVGNKKKKVIKKYKLSRHFISSVNFLSLMGTFRDDRKAFNQMGCGVLNMFAKEFSKRTKIKLLDIENMYTWEVKDIFKKKSELINKSKKRKSASFFVIKNIEKNIEFNGSVAEKLNKIIKDKILKSDELSGRTAYPGKVKGRAKIILNKKDFYKMKEGNILVAPNTRPEYVPIMKKAKAIISDEGGVTCHSAIVSREMKIPCIVGVQTASIILKDNDYIEVDAERGIIRKLK